MCIVVRYGALRPSGRLRDDATENLQPPSRVAFLGEPAQYPLLLVSGGLGGSWTAQFSRDMCGASPLDDRSTSCAIGHLGTIKEGLAILIVIVSVSVDAFHFLPMLLLREALRKSTYSLLERCSECFFQDDDA